MADLDKLVEELGKLSVLDAAQLVKKLEEKLGVSAAAAAPVVVAGAAGGPGGAAAARWHDSPASSQTSRRPGTPG